MTRDEAQRAARWEWSTVLFAVGEWAIERGDWPRIAV